MRFHLRDLALAATLAVPLVMPVVSVGQDQAKPDNTKVNKRDTKADEPTASSQKGNAADRELTRKIRRALVQDKSLSTYAHNIKVITQDGKVTLKGPVHTDNEKRAVEAKAVEIAGKDNVTDQISVTGDADRSKK